MPCNEVQPSYDIRPKLRNGLPKTKNTQTKKALVHRALKINFYHPTDICQIRLDFDSVTMAQPSTTTTAIGTCSDEVKATSPTSFSPPTICGTLTGTHSENI